MLPRRFCVAADGTDRRLVAGNIHGKLVASRVLRLAAAGAAVGVALLGDRPGFGKMMSERWKLF